MKERSAYVEVMAAPAPMTAEELQALHLPNKRTELVRGRLVVREPAGFLHGVIAARLCSRVEAHVRAHALGVVLAAETGFKLFSNPDTVRAPDVGFVRASRVPHPVPKNYPPMSPDLAVEVLSPDDRAGDVLEKIADWLNAGCELVWVIDPERRLARVYRADGTESLLGANDDLRGEELLPGFTCKLSELL